MPDPYNSIDWDRYAYARNNPLRFTDPTGHDPEEILFNKKGYLPEEPEKDPEQRSRDYPSNNPSKLQCNSTLSGCFGDTVYLKDFSQNGERNPIPIAEFTSFTDEVAEDLYSHDITWPGYSAGRQTYDTPFYNGGESERRTGEEGSQVGIYPADQQVCIEGLRCSGRSEINYIAQGMWGAATGEPKIVTNLIVRTWKFVEYGEAPSEDTLFWLNYGYDYYQNWEANQGK